MTDARTGKTATKASATGPKPANKRGAARLAAVQALYQMDTAGSGVLVTMLPTAGRAAAMRRWTKGPALSSRPSA